MVDMGITKFGISGPKSRSVNNSSQRSDFGLLGCIWNIFGTYLGQYAGRVFLDDLKMNTIYIYMIPGGASSPSDPPIKSAWRPPNMDMYSGCYIQNMDVYSLDFGNLGTNVANGSIRILTLDITSRIYIQIRVIWVPMLQMDRSEH